MSLLVLQREFRRWLVEESTNAALHFGGGDAPGLAIYLNNYRSQLSACLREGYTTVHAWIGDRQFEDAIAKHVSRVQPSAWTLDVYVRDFPDTLKLLYPEDPEVTDLALIERALSEAFVGPDAPNLVIGDPTEIDWDHARLRPVPTFTMLFLTTNAPAIWSAINNEKPPPSATLFAEPLTIAVWRAGFAPSFRTLEAGEADALRRIAGGTSFGALCAVLAERHGVTEGPAIAGAWLGQWLGEGLIAAIEANEPTGQVTT